MPIFNFYFEKANHYAITIMISPGPNNDILEGPEPNYTFRDSRRNIRLQNRKSVLETENREIFIFIRMAQASSFFSSGKDC